MGFDRFRLLRFAAPAAVVLLLGGCMMGDDVFSVTGRIVDGEGKGLDSCMMALQEMEEHDMAYPFQWEPTMGSEIRRSYVWPFSRSSQFRLGISCPGRPEPYWTPPFKAREAIRAYPEPVDFGVIVMAGSDA